MNPAIIIGAAQHLATVVTGLAEDPHTYKKLDAIRQFVEEVTGTSISPSGFLTFMEEATQGEPFTGEWEELEEFYALADPGKVIIQTQRLRTESGWIYARSDWHCGLEVRDGK